MSNKRGPKKPLKIGDFACIISRSYNISHPLWQTIGRVVDIQHANNDPFYIFQFPKAIPQCYDRWGCYSEILRRATAYEGMMAFWDPEEETRRFFDRQEQFKQDRQLMAAHQKVAQSNLSAEDF